jgi:hypothetical protein
MTTILTEKNLIGSILIFEFSDNWQVCKYDDQLFYKKLTGLQAVDFMGLSDKRLLLMEIKYILATDENRVLLTNNSY